MHFQRNRAMHLVSSMLLTAVLTLSGVFLSTGSALAQDPAAEALIEKYIQAMGGREAFSKLKSRIAKGEFAVPDYGMFAPMETYAIPPDKSFFTIDTGGSGDASSGVLGDLVWDVNPMVGARILKGAERANRLRQANWDQLLDWKTNFKEARLGEDKEVGGKACSQLILTPHEGEPVTMFLDKETTLAAEIRTTVAGVSTSATLSDFREVDGVKIPFATNISSDQFSFEIRLESVEHNVDIPESRFDPPPAIKALADK